MIRRARAHGFPAARVNPLTAIGWQAAYWADDPQWASPGDGNPVASWRDGAGPYDLAQASSGSQPTYRTGVASLNGASAVEFDGLNDALIAPMPSISQPHSTVLIIDLPTLGGDSVIADADSVGAAAVFYLGSSKRWTIYAGDGGTALSLTAPLATVGLNAVRTTMNGVTSAISCNGTAEAGSITAYLGYTGITLGTVRTGFGLFAHCRIAFAGFYEGDITTDPAWGAVRSIMATLYGATLS